MKRAHAIAVALTLLTAVAGYAQPPTPSTNDLPSFFTIGSGASPAFGQDGGFTDTTGTAGTNPGWSLFRYGTAGSSSGRLRITAVSSSPATTTYWTATPAEPNLSAAAMHFDTSTAASWTIVTPKTGANAPLQVTVDDNSPTTFLALTDPAQLGAYNARLNQVLKFDASNWFDPATNAPIGIDVGTFSFGFTDFNATLGYRSIQLQFVPATPVPEPTGLLALAALALGSVGVLHRLRRTAGYARPSDERPVGIQAAIAVVRMSCGIPTRASTCSVVKRASGPCGATSMNGDSYSSEASMTARSVRWSMMRFTNST